MNDLRRIIWLASFPKSGNTWVRSFLANYFQPPGKTLDINSLRLFTTADIRQDFFDAANGAPFRGQSIEEWLAVRPKALRLIAGSKPGHHFVKTHCQVLKMKGVDLIPPEVTAAAVYLIRNPFDVAPSYSRHLAMDMDATIDRMLDAEAIGSNPGGVLEIVGRWDRHIETWTGARGLPLHVMRYEDMVANADRAFRKLFAFLRIKVDKMQMSRAMQATSFAAMQRQEREQGFRERPQEMAQFFVRGTSGGWRDDLSPAQVQRLREAFLPTLEKWYPEMLAETESFAGTA